MASAIIGGLLAQNMPLDQITVIEPWDIARDTLHTKFGMLATPDASLVAGELAQVDLVVWAVKPQTFEQATAPVANHVRGALHLSVAAGITTDSIAQWLGTQRIVRAMPNTPALVGQGMTGLFACSNVDPAGRVLVEHVVRPTGQFIWVEQERLLDAVTALSGSGPAYVFLFMESMIQAGMEMGLSAAQAQQLAIATFKGASELAAKSDERPDVLRQRVTSKGGTTHAAITHLQMQQVPAHFIAAIHAAQERAQALAAEFGAGPAR